MHISYTFRPMYLAGLGISAHGLIPGWSLDFVERRN